MSRGFYARRIRHWPGYFALSLLLFVLCSCSFFGLGAAPPPVWTHYQNQAFTMDYITSWSPATKDLYFGTSYPQLEMLQGMIFTEQSSATTFVQVVYASATNSNASVSNLLCKYILGTLKQPLASSNLTTIKLAGETWSQGVVEKQVSSTGSPGGSPQTVKETALGVSYTVSAGKTEIYLIIYQDATSTYSQTNHDFFTRMVNSFHFGTAS